MTVLPLPFQFGYLLFLFLVWLLCLGLPILCWIEVLSGYPCLLSEFNRKSFSFSPLSIILAVGLSYMVFIILSRFPLCLFPERFYHNWVLILSKAFSASIEMIIWFFSFSLLIWCITLIDLHILKNPCIPGINPTWSWCMILLMCCWILFASILLRIFASMLISDIGL